MESLTVTSDVPEYLFNKSSVYNASVAIEWTDIQGWFIYSYGADSHPDCRQQDLSHLHLFYDLSTIWSNQTFGLELLEPTSGQFRIKIDSTIALAPTVFYIREMTQG